MLISYVRLDHTLYSINYGITIIHGDYKCLREVNSIIYAITVHA